MVQAHDRTATNLVLLLTTILAYVGAQATIGALGNGSSSSLPGPSTCAFTSVNHITQTLPQQCLVTAWPRKAAEQVIAAKSEEHTHDRVLFSDANTGTPTATSSVKCTEPALHTSSHHPHQQASEIHSPDQTSSTSAARAETSSTDTVEDLADGDLDNANFLSFEEWKRRNLAKAGQSADNVGGGRSGTAEPRRRPAGINNALDSLGEDTEIEIDFGGFVNPPAPGTQHAGQINPGESGGPTHDAGDKKSSAQFSKAHSRSKDAGITCKERSNYASFDCASTILKTNPECKSATSVLVENKDSYMLNICSADNKFLIVELCDDILVDTVVLANFEFFSSIFRTFRVSVSDRYPVKLDKWRDLGTFEAQNSRGIQAFLVEEPQIWARYLRIEFLTHFGQEYYCPVSLLRVHGTTMMEEFNHELKNSRGDEEADDEQTEEASAVPDVVTADVLKREFTASAEQSTTTAPSTTDGPVPSATGKTFADEQINPHHTAPVADTTPWDNSALAQIAMVLPSGKSHVRVCSPSEAPEEPPLPPSAHAVSKEADLARSQTPTSSTRARPGESAPSSSPSTSINGQSSAAVSSHSTSNDTIHSIASDSTRASSKTATPSLNPPPKSPSSTNPSPPHPTTQESFFKSVHKRLQLLESNSTLSLQYIEDQSRILRDAFASVSRRQLTKTNTFLEVLNSTVLNEVREFRNQYDQIWQSTVLELSSQRQQSQVEMEALSSRLKLLADEVVFQKRIAILQFLLILLCLGLALFSRGSTGSDYLEHVVNKSSLNLSRYASHLDSPSGSPTSTRPPSRYGFFSRAASSLHRRSPSEESMGLGERDGTKSPSIEYSPPTPTSLSEGSGDGDGSPERSSSSPERTGGKVRRSKEARRNDHGGTNGLLSPDHQGSSGSSGSSSGTTLVESDAIRSS
ncbi:MAG: hypothetical protein L6R39_005690 [Caloplaca ligustica]|nr:MAG: hypothetical protein L6R39_005690 [Caloplaca ligustica]